MPPRLALLTAGLALGAAACVTPNAPRRTFDPGNPAALADRQCDRLSPPALTGTIDTSVSALQDPATRHLASCYATEGHRPSSGGAFTLHTLEFDDQGVPWNSERLQQSLRAIEAAIAGPEDALVIVFVHGWFNNAGVCNGKLACFRELLELAALAEQQFAPIFNHKPRQVIGVYAAWRGETNRFAVTGKHLTFWSRKSTAHVIGDNSAATTAFVRLAGAVDRRPRSTLVYIGHSFGGALLYSALSNILSERVAEAQKWLRSRTDPHSGRTIRTAAPTEGPARLPGIGDLVVLVNPAMEASRYYNMNELVRGVDTFAATQLPIFMTLSSQGDTPNQVLFPIGQSLSAFSRAARSNRQWLTMVQSIGTYRSYHSHVLKSRPGRKAMTASGAVGSCLCQQNLSAVSRPLLAELQDLFTALADGTYPAELDLGNSREFAYSRLEAQTTLSPHIPFMVVSVDKAIIPNHGDIFTPEIVDFLLEYIALIQHKRTQVGTPPRK